MKHSRGKGVPYRAGAGAVCSCKAVCASPHVHRPVCQRVLQACMCWAGQPGRAVLLLVFLLYQQCFVGVCVFVDVPCVTAQMVVRNSLGRIMQLGRFMEVLLVSVVQSGATGSSFEAVLQQCKQSHAFMQHWWGWVQPTIVAVLQG